VTVDFAPIKDSGIGELAARFDISSWAGRRKRRN
jgi:hypothetical protein